MKRAFTLIELLVVVLIVGILAAIALPQYQAARDKALIATYLPVFRSIQEAEELIYMENGTYERELSTLAIDVTNACAVTYHNMLFGCKEGYLNITYNDSKIIGEMEFVFCPALKQEVTINNYPSCAQQRDMKIIFYFNQHATKPGKTECDFNTPRGKRVCQMFKQ